MFTVNLTNPADSIVAKKSAYSGTDLTRIAVYKVSAVSVYDDVLSKFVFTNM